jgi:hypothetical protein
MARAGLGGPTGARWWPHLPGAADLWLWLGAGLTLAGVYLLCGLGWTLLAGGVFGIAYSAVLNLVDWASLRALGGAGSPGQQAGHGRLQGTRAAPPPGDRRAA